MHPRNPLHSIDFQELSTAFKALEEYVKPGKKQKIDFKNPRFNRLLTCAILWKYFNLRLEIPLSNLIPAVPNRLDYLLVLKDLINDATMMPVTGVDIGTGASCIYPLLGCSLEANWSFYATEIDDESIKFANENVSRNNLDDRIRILKGTETRIIPRLDEDIDFVMCNPPFYNSEEQIQASKLLKTMDSQSACSGNKREMITKGGEVEFIKQMMMESKSLKNIKLFSCLVGIKADVDILSDFLKCNEIANNPKVHRIQQGKTARWIISWQVAGSRNSPP